MNDKDISKYIERYNGRLDMFGYDPRTLGWGGGKERQYLRFKILSEIGIGLNDSVLDIGCGFADFYGYLQENGWTGQYLGVDINPNLLETARNQYPGVRLEVLDILNDPVGNNYDWVVESGIFNAKLEYEGNLDYIEKMIKKMYEIAIKGVACDFMSSYTDYQHAEAFHADPADIIRISKNLGAKIIVRMDYLPYEYAVYCKK
ncbi:class I SAM-dependent methyltransferase [bacterium]|nr:class I SAM-dependent methyltransferase [bacterium]